MSLEEYLSIEDTESKEGLSSKEESVDKIILEELATLLDIN